MTCEWARTDCQNFGKKCDFCFVDSQHYLPIKAKAKPQLAHRQQKADKRMGGQFEYRNHQANKDLLKTDTSSAMTINSGAWIQKGDEQIRGMIHIMEELKTKVVTQAPGKETFTMKRSWLEKLNREAREAGEEFWYLKFSFHEHDKDVYIAIEQEQIMSMVVTMVQDRKDARLAQSKIDVAEARKNLVEAENLKLQAEILLLQAELKQLKEEREDADI